MCDLPHDLTGFFVRLRGLNEGEGADIPIRSYSYTRLLRARNDQHFHSPRNCNGCSSSVQALRDTSDSSRSVRMEDIGPRRFVTDTATPHESLPGRSPPCRRSAARDDSPPVSE